MEIETSYVRTRSHSVKKKVPTCISPLIKISIVNVQSYNAFLMLISYLTETSSSISITSLFCQTRHIAATFQTSRITIMSRSTNGTLSRAEAFQTWTLTISYVADSFYWTGSYPIAVTRLTTDYRIVAERSRFAFVAFVSSHPWCACTTTFDVITVWTVACWNRNKEHIVLRWLDR